MIMKISENKEELPRPLDKLARLFLQNPEQNIIQSAVKYNNEIENYVKERQIEPTVYQFLPPQCLLKGFLAKLGILLQEKDQN